ncbi:MAG: DUF1992 domain-containing protein [Chloroflexi bacterium]|nr:DUF1992 domain-containing protein [Chloroflexota bacterium]
MSVFDKSVEAILKEAVARGEFDNLPNAGKELDLTEYFNTPEEFRVAASILKNAGIKPREAYLLREIAEEKKKLASCQDSAEQAKIQERIQYLQIGLNLALERIQQQRRK